MAEMKNICGKIPMDLHEKVREEIVLITKLIANTVSKLNSTHN